MKQRCNDKNDQSYDRYGGRGITVCQEWSKSFKAFHSWGIAIGYRKGLTIERIDNNGDYEPSNCTWIPPEQQAKNKRTSRFITYKNKTKILKEWSSILSIKYITLYMRLQRGWSVKKAFEYPLGKKNNGN